MFVTIIKKKQNIEELQENISYHLYITGLNRFYSKACWIKRKSIGRLY